jgi:hypothetical protein
LTLLRLLKVNLTVYLNTIIAAFPHTRSIAAFTLASIQRMSSRLAATSACSAFGDDGALGFD